jgi:YVTN family beta-propeller protein
VGRFSVIATIRVGERPYALAIAGNPARLFVTNQYDNSVSVIDLETYALLKTIRVGEYPEGIVSSPDGRKVVVANWFDNTVSVIDVARLEVIKTIPTGNGSRAFGQFMPRGD